MIRISASIDDAEMRIFFAAAWIFICQVGATYHYNISLVGRICMVRNNNCYKVYTY